MTKSTGMVRDPIRERAWRAVKEFRKLRTSLDVYARAVTGNPKVRVVVTEGTNCTDGVKIFIRPPIQLGDNIPHEREYCNKRGEDKRQLCTACGVREMAMGAVFHEIAHIVFGTYVTPNEQGIGAIRNLIREWHPVGACQHYDQILDTWRLDEFHYLDYADSFYPVFQYLVNALEDSRVNAAQFRARPGTQAIMAANLNAIFEQGTKGDGSEGDKWQDRPLAMQVLIGLFLESSGYYDLTDTLDEKAQRALREPDVATVMAQIAEAEDAHRLVVLSCEAFRLLAAANVFNVPKCEIPPPMPPMPSGDPGDQSDSGTPEAGDDQKKDDAESSQQDSEQDDQQEQDPDAGGEFGQSDQGTAQPPPASNSGSSGDTDDDTDSSDDAGDSDDTSTGQAGNSTPGKADDESGGDSSSDLRDEPGDHEDSSSDDAGGPDAGGSDEDTDSGGSSTATDVDAKSGPEADSPSDTSESGDDGSVNPSDSRSDDTDQVDSDGEESDEGRGDTDSSVREDRPGDDGRDGDSPEGSGSEASDNLGDNEGDSDGSTEESSGQDSGSGGTESGEAGAGDEAESSDRSDEPAAGHEGPGTEPSSETDESGEESGGGPRDQSTPLVPDYQPSEFDPDAEHESMPTPQSPGDVPEPEPVIEPLTPDEILEALKYVTLHNILQGRDNFATGDSEISEQNITDDPGTYVAEIDPDVLEAVTFAVLQSAVFDTWSSDVRSLKLVKYGDRVHRWYPAFDPDDFKPGEGVISRTVQEARIAFDANARGRRLGNLKSGKVDSRNLAKRVPQNDPRMFKRHVLPKRRDYKVFITSDISGSTRTSDRITRIKRATYGQAEMLHRVGVPFELWAHSAGYIVDEFDTPDFSVMDMWMFEVKTVTETWNDKAKRKLADLRPQSGNLDGHTLEFLRKRAEAVHAQDAIICYYTDGAMPASNYDEELEILQREIKICRDRNIVLMSVGIETDAPEEHGFVNVRVDSDDDLPKVVRKLKELMT